MSTAHIGMTNKQGKKIQWGVGIRRVWYKQGGPEFSWDGYRRKKDTRSWWDDENIEAAVVSRGPEEYGCFDRSWEQRGRKQSKNSCVKYISH